MQNMSEMTLSINVSGSIPESNVASLLAASGVKTQLTDIGINEKSQAIRRALTLKFPEKPGGASGMDCSGPCSVWDRDIYDTYVIFEWGAKLWKADYTIDDKLNVVLGEPQCVRISYVAASDGSTVHPVTAATLVPMTAAEFGLCELDDTGMPITAADKEPYGADADYADPGYQSDKVKRYPLDSEKHIRAANSYIAQEKNSAKYSPEQVSHIKAKIVSAWKAKIDPAGPPSAAEKSSDPPTPAVTMADVESNPSLINRCGHFVWLLSDPDTLSAISLNGKEVYELPIAVTGTWMKGGKRFSITDADLDDMIKNFNDRGPGNVVVDYEHASEQPEVAQGKEVPAAGWFYQLAKKSIVNAKGKVLNALTALIEFTPRALDMLKNAEYKFFSPAIAFTKMDKETGKPLGTYLNSGALTNHPFLEDLPPIVLSDMLLATSTQAVHVGTETLPAPDFDNKNLADPAAGKQDKKEKKRMAKQIKKIADGPDAGKFGMYSEDGKLAKVFSKKMSDRMEGMSEADLNDIMCDLKLDDAEPDPADKDEKKEKDETQDGKGTGVNASEKTPPAAPAADPNKEGNKPMEKTTPELLAECINAEGHIDSTKVITLAATAKITATEASDAVALNDVVAGAVSKGQFLPGQFATAVGWALRDRKGFDTFLATAKPQVDLSTRGLNLTDSKGDSVITMSEPETKFLKLTEEMLNKGKAANPEYTYEMAVGAASRIDPALYKQYRESTVNLTERPEAKRVTFM